MLLKKITVLVFSLFCTAFIFTEHAIGSTIYVDDSAIGNNDGTSWADAYVDLQDALSTSIAGDEIWLAAGTYTPSQVGDRTATFQLKNGVGLYGGFNGTETQRDERDYEANVTILSGDLNGDDGPDFLNNGENSYHVVTGSGTDATAVMDGFTISGGNATGWPNLEGGGMYNYGGTPTVNNCIFSDNSADLGAGMYNRSNSPHLHNCVFRKNLAMSDGGGMANQYSSPVLSTCIFSGNSASQDGGGMANYSSNPILMNCTFRRNSAQENGGGMNNIYSSSPTLMNCTFSGNLVPTIIGRGGGMYNYNNSNPILSNCILWADTQQEIYGSSIVTYSNIQGGYAGIGNIDVDPLFIDPDGPDNIPGTEDDDLRLAAGSPSIDAGDNTAVPSDIYDLDGDGDTTEPLPFDLAGVDRFFDDPATADTGNGTAPIVDMGAHEYVALTDWPMFRFNPQHTAHAAFDMPDTIELLWSYETGHFVNSSPAVTGGKVFIGSCDGLVYAFEEETGNLLWSYVTGGHVHAAPAVENGKVFVGSLDGTFYVLAEDDGTELWTFEAGGSISTSATVTADKVFFGAGNGKIFALDPDNGNEIWVYETASWGISSPAVANGKVFFGSDNGNVYALDTEDGTESWIFGTGGYVKSSPAVADGQVFVGSVDGNLYVLNEVDGALVWSAGVSGGTESSPAVANGKVFTSSEGGYLYALNAVDGTELWSVQNGYFRRSSPAVGSGAVFVGGSDGNVYSLG